MSEIRDKVARAMADRIAEVNPGGGFRWRFDELSQLGRRNARIAADAAISAHLAALQSDEATIERVARAIDPKGWDSRERQITLVRKARAALAAIAEVTE